MAVNDVISDYNEQVANGAEMDIQPASGDEWLITHVLQSQTGSGVHLRSHTSDENAYVGMWGGQTATTTDRFDRMGLHECRFLLTNSEYIRLHNAAGATHTFGFSGIKIKE
jgi:hypothetical protein